MKKDKIFEKIKKTPTDQNWLDQGRQTLHSFIVDNPVRKPELDRQQMQERSLKKLILKPMPIAIIALIVSLATGGGVMAAAQDSLPTEILYPIKLITEKIQEVATFDEVKKVELQTRLADRRLAEIQELQDENKATEEVVAQTLEKYEKHLTIAQGYLYNVEQNYEVEEVASTAIDLESALVKQEVILNNIEARASPAYQGTLTLAKEATVESHGVTTGVIERTESLPTLTTNNRFVPLNQKFEIKVKEKVAVRGENIQIVLTETTLCPPCPEGQFCTLACTSPGARFTISYAPLKMASQQINLTLGQQENIGLNVYLKLLNVNDNQVTVILTKRDNTPNDKMISLNQKFDLTPGQTATVTDYQNLKIDFQGIAEVMCVKAPCPGPMATFQATLPSQCYGQGTASSPINSIEINSGAREAAPSTVISTCTEGAVTNFSLTADQGKEIFGARVTLLSLTRSTATLIITNHRIGCPEIAILCENGEPIKTGTDDHGCPVYECQSPDCTVPRCIGAYRTGELNPNDNCPVYKCPEISCETRFSSCNCSYECMEIIPGQELTDCARACSRQEISNYSPNCGYRNGICRDLNEDDDDEMILPVEIEEITEAQVGGSDGEIGAVETEESFFTPLLKILGL